MTLGTEAHPPWRDDPWSLDTMALIAEGLTTQAGFEIACLDILLGEGFVTVAVAGDDEARAQLLWKPTPVDVIERELAHAEDWGAFKFVSHEHSTIEDAQEHFWVPDFEPTGAEGDWHPLNMLAAPLLDDAGRMRGLLYLDLPRDGRLPGPEQRRVMDTFAEQARHAVLATLERSELSERVRLATAAREAVRRASVQLEPVELLAEIHPALLRGFRARGLWLQVFGEGGPGDGLALTGDGDPLDLPPALFEVAHRSAQQAWQRRTVPVIDHREPDLVGDYLDEADSAQVWAFLRSIGIGSLLFVPVGAGTEALGNLVITRGWDEPLWTEVETDAALDIGQDLGRIMLNARTFATERKLVASLRELDEYKSELIATVAHELKSPLSAVVGHLELLTGHPLAQDSAGQASLQTIERGTSRLRRTVDDLLVLAQVANPHQLPVTEHVDLREVVWEVQQLTALAVQHRGHVWHEQLPDEPVCVVGDRDQLERVLTNLVSNAVKYSPEEGSVTVDLAVRDRVAVLSVKDRGLGVSEEDKAQLFTEFFRSATPDARAQPGTGLGLAIVSRIVARHGGSVEVDSTLGLGSTFSVVLPLVPGPGRL